MNARIPPVLISAVETLLSQTVPSIRSEINRKDIVLGDYSWLGFGDDPRTAAYQKRRDVDILMKLPLRPVAVGRDVSGGGAQALRRRRCVRCCEVSGDGGRPRTGPWTKMMHRLNLLRTCACGGAWVMEILEPVIEGGQGVGALVPGHVSASRAVGVMGSG